jgi:hypothetical protein
MMHGHEKSDPAIVAGKPTNKAEQSAAELVEPRVGPRGMRAKLGTCWTQCQATPGPDPVTFTVEAIWGSILHVVRHGVFPENWTRDSPTPRQS